MDPVTIATTATTAYKVGKAAYGTIKELNDILASAKDSQINSLSAYTKRTLITSRVFIEDQIANEKAIPNLLKLCNHMYCGFVMVTIGLHRLVMTGGMKTVKSMLNAVGTEDFHAFKDLINDAFVVPGLEGNHGGDDKKDDPEKDKHNVSFNQKELETKGEALFCGRLMEADIPDGHGGKVPLFFYVQLLPTILPQIVMNEFIGLNTDPSKSLRKAMYKAGEISFWKDYIFERDRVEKRRKALAADKEGILREVEDVRAQQLCKSLKNLTETAANRRRNLANSIVIVSKQTMDKVCKDLGLNLRQYGDRQNVMNNILATMLIVYDANYGTVDMYMNGISNRGEYTAAMIEKAAKGDSKDDDIKTLLQLIAAGNMPRF